MTKPLTDCQIQRLDIIMSENNKQRVSLSVFHRILEKFSNCFCVNEMGGFYQTQTRKVAELRH